MSRTRAYISVSRESARVVAQGMGGLGAEDRFTDTGDAPGQS